MDCSYYFTKSFTTNSVHSHQYCSMQQQAARFSRQAQDLMEVYVQTLQYQPGNVMTRLWEAALNCFCQETVPGLVKELAFATLKKAKPTPYLQSLC